MPLRIFLPFHFFLLVTICTTLAATSAGATSSPQSRTVQVREVPGGLVLVIEPLGLPPELDRLTVEQARRVLATFHEDLGLVTMQARFSQGSEALAVANLKGGLAEVWEEHLREKYFLAYGSPEVNLLPSLTSERLVEALRLSPKYMQEGVREAATELFADPIFLAGVSTSVVA